MIKSRYISALLSLLLCFVLASCASMPPEAESRSEFVQQQKSAARALHSGGDLAQSRTLWLTVLALDGGDTEAKSAVGELDIAIARQVDKAWRSGQAAYKHGKSREGDLWMLRLLAVQPGHKAALAQLQKNYSAYAQTQQKAKSTVENTLIVARQAAAPGGVNQQVKGLYNAGKYTQALSLGENTTGTPDPEVADILRKSHIALAQLAEQSGELAIALGHVEGAISSSPQANDPLLSRSVALRAQLSTLWYKQGLGLMKTDLDEAIAAFEKALFYNPYNNIAKRKLLQAQTLQKNLKRIQANG